MKWLRAHLHQVLGLTFLAGGLLRAWLPVTRLRTIGPAQWTITQRVANWPMTVLQCSALVVVGLLALAWPRLSALVTQLRNQ